MENLLQVLIDQNERLISAVEAVGEKIDYFQNSIRADLILSNSSSNVSSIDEMLGEITSVLGIIGDRSILTDIHEELQDIKSAIDILDSTVQVEAEALKKA